MNITKLYQIFHLVSFLFALYLSYKCNKNNFTLIGLLFVCCCPYFYIIYHFIFSKYCTDDISRLFNRSYY